LGDIAEMISAGRQHAARSVNAAMTATYWLIGRRIIEAEQGGATRARYGEELIVKLSGDLLARAGRGFGRRNLEQMRRFFLMGADLLERREADRFREVKRSASAQASVSG
jgi:uncharacterized protein DUF1016